MPYISKSFSKFISLCPCIVGQEICLFHRPTHVLSAAQEVQMNRVGEGMVLQKAELRFLITVTQQQDVFHGGPQLDFNLRQREKSAERDMYSTHRYLHWGREERLPGLSMQGKAGQGKGWSLRPLFVVGISHPASCWTWYTPNV